MTNDVKHCFMCFISHLYIFFDETLSTYFVFLWGLLVPNDWILWPPLTFSLLTGMAASM